MSSIKVSALTAKTTPAGTEELLINDSGVSKKITIANLPDTDTTYSNFAGTTAGLVPTSTTGDDTKFLRADGTWVVPTDTDTNTTYTSSDFTHNSLSGVTANEHIDWTTDQGATNIHAGNYTDTDTGITDVVDDTTPQLGGDLDFQTHKATSFTSTGIDDNATSTAITIDASENVGIGVTPETDWDASWDALQLGVGASIVGYTSGSDSAVAISSNAKYTTTSYDNGNQYINTKSASKYIQKNDGQHVFQVAPSGTADAAITWTTGFEVLNDGKARAKNGLLFGTDTAAANALDDYEEGEYSYTITGNTSGSMTPKASYTKFAYTKIGRKVTVQGKFETSGTHTATGYLKFSLPFAAANLTDQAGNAPAAFFLYRTGLANVYNPVAIVSDNSSHCLVYYNIIANNEVTTLDGEDVDSSIEGLLSLTYMTT